MARPCLGLWTRLSGQLPEHPGCNGLACLLGRFVALGIRAGAWHMLGECSTLSHVCSPETSMLRYIGGWEPTVFLIFLSHNSLRSSRGTSVVIWYETYLGCFQVCHGEGVGHRNHLPRTMSFSRSRPSPKFPTTSFPLPLNGAMKEPLHCVILQATRGLTVAAAQYVQPVHSSFLYFSV